MPRGFLHPLRKGGGSGGGERGGVAGWKELELRNLNPVQGGRGAEKAPGECLGESKRTGGQERVWKTVCRIRRVKNTHLVSRNRLAF